MTPVPAHDADAFCGAPGGARRGTCPGEADRHGHHNGHRDSAAASAAALPPSVRSRTAAAAGLLLAMAAAAGLGAGQAWAQATPVGLWKTVDDETRQEKSLVRISEHGGVLQGRIDKLLSPGANPDAVCERCTDERKGQRLVGLQIIRNARPDADGQTWEGGEILDPAKGKTYTLRLRPLDGGKRLEVRGYLGPFYRNQHWIRVE